MLHGDKVSIRTFRIGDLDKLVRLMENIENQGQFLPTSMASDVLIRNEYNQTGFITESTSKYAVVDRNERLVGMIWAFKSVPYFDALEVGYHIFKSEHRGNGYATEAVGLITTYLFESKQVNRLEIRMPAGNEASERVAVKAGFELEGTHREAAFSKGRLHDMHTYAILRSTWVANRVGHTTGA
jgi:ribosomal-protein-alanine N-acetyltransferase